MIAIARLSVVEAMRRRVIWVLVGLTVGVVVITGWGFDQIMQGVPDVSRDTLNSGLSRLLIFVMFMFSFVLAMVAASIAAPSVASEIESGQAQAVLARPIHRWHYLLGRWLGLGLVVVAYAIASGTLELVAVGAITGYVPRSPLGCVVFLAAQGMVIFTFGLLLSTRLPAIASGAVAVVLFGICWVIGILGSLGSFLGTDALRGLARVTRFLFPSDGLWRAATDSATPANDVYGNVLSGFGDPFAGGGAPTLGYLLFVAGWFLVILLLAAFSLSRREL